MQNQSINQEKKPQPSPQAHQEYTYTKFPNWLLDSIYQYDFNFSHVTILIVLARKIYGFHKETVDISRSFLADIVGMDPSQVTRAITDLVVGNVITRRKGNLGHIFSINHVSKWTIPLKVRVGGNKLFSLRAITNANMGNSLAPGGGDDLSPLGGDDLSPNEIKDSFKEKITTTAKRMVANEKDVVVVLSLKTENQNLSNNEVVSTIPPATAAVEPVANIATSMANTSSNQSWPPASPINAPQCVLKAISPYPQCSLEETIVIQKIAASKPSEVVAGPMEELMARLRLSKKIDNPVGYFRVLLKESQAGTFAPVASKKEAEVAVAAKIAQEKQEEESREKKIAAARERDENAKLDDILARIDPSVMIRLRNEFIDHLTRTNSFMHDFYRKQGFKGLGFENLFRYYLRDELLGVTY